MIALRCDWVNSILTRTWLVNLSSLLCWVPIGCSG